MSGWQTPPAGMAAAIAACLSAQVPEIETPRLRLRAPRIGDFATYAAFVRSSRGLHVDGAMDREEAWLDFTRMVAGWLLRGYGLWSIERRSDDALVGFLPLNHTVGDSAAEHGWFLTAEGRGYAREAAAAARAHTDRHLGLERLVSHVAPETARSIRLGAARDGRLEENAALSFRHLPVRGRA